MSLLTRLSAELGSVALDREVDFPVLCDPKALPAQKLCRPLTWGTFFRVQATGDGPHLPPLHLLSLF